MLEQPAIVETGLVCPICGGRRTEDDVRDQRCCMDCRKGKGTLGLLDTQFRTGSPEVDSCLDWPAIKHFACKLFSLVVFNSSVLDRLEDWLQAEHRKSREQMLAMQTSEVAAMLRAACAPTPPIKPKGPVDYRAGQALGTPTAADGRPLVNSTDDPFTNSPGRIWSVEDYYREKELYDKHGVVFNPALEAGSPAAYHVITQHYYQATAPDAQTFGDVFGGLQVKPDNPDGKLWRAYSDIIVACDLQGGNQKEALRKVRAKVCQYHDIDVVQANTMPLSQFAVLWKAISNAGPGVPPQVDKTGLDEGDLPQFISDRLRAGDAIITAEEAAHWPDGILDRLLQSGALVPAENAKSAVCDACGHDHIEEVVYVESPPGSGPRAYISCPELGRVAVGLDRLRQWAVVPERLAHFLTPKTSGNGRDSASDYLFRRVGELWQVRFADEHGTFNHVDGMLYLVHLLRHPAQRFSAFGLKRLLSAGTTALPNRTLTGESQEILARDIAVTDETRQEVIDEEAVEQCQQRLTQIAEEREAVRQAGDLERLEELEDEESKINGYLAKARDIRGDFRAIADKKRSVFNSVRQAINRAIRKFETADPPLPGLTCHLSKAIESGNGGFEYRPNSPTPPWQF